MTTSTPIDNNRRESNLLTQMETDFGLSCNMRTGISDETGMLELTPPLSETSSQIEGRFGRDVRDLNYNVEFAGELKRSRSMPDNLEENAFYKDFPTRLELKNLIRSRFVGFLITEDTKFLEE